MTTGSLEDLKNKIKEYPVSDILGQYMTIHRKGAQTLAVCPFHDDSNPSLQINDHKEMWYCFVDNLGGDAIKFVQLYKNIGYVEALEDICQSFGWDFTQYQSQTKQSPKLEMGRKILTKTTHLYKKCAETKSFPAFQEFINLRKINEETASQYQLGISPKNNALYEYLNSIPDQKERDFALSIASQLGLIRPSKYDGQEYYDTFRERIMFPIFDQRGQVIGFTSKITREDQKPRYLNSIESFMFNKSELLYGINFAKNAIRQQDAVILVEGNMDQITVNQAGFQHCVAIMGTALTENNVAYLLKLTKNIYLCLDNDQGGKQASIKANSLFMAQGVTPKLVSLENVKDPDEFITENGGLAFQKQIESAETMIDVILKALVEKGKDCSTEETLTLLQEGFKALTPLKDSLQATERIVKFSQELGLKSDSTMILENYKHYLQGNIAKQTTHVKKPTEQENKKNDIEEIHVDLPPTKITKVEKTLLQNLIQFPELLGHDELSKLLDFISESEVKRFVCAVKDIYFEIDEAEYLSVIRSIISGDKYSEDLSTTVGAALWAYRAHPLEEKVVDEMLVDLSAKLEEEMLRDKKVSIKNQQKSILDKETQDKFFEELITVEKRLDQLKKNIRKKSSTII